MTTFELDLYNVVLQLASGVNLMMAFILLHNNSWYRDYDVYRHARTFTAVTFAIFGIGFLLHQNFDWRTTWPAGASALSVSYFHIGAVLFGWSIITLLRPDYLTRRVAVRDLAILVIGIAIYWLCALYPQFRFHDIQYAIFFCHGVHITYTFYNTYYHVRSSITQMPTDATAPEWWTDEARSTVLNAHNSFVIGANLIIVFGLGSVLVTALFPTQIWPYTILLTLGIFVFLYIFYSLTEYGTVIEAGTCLTEDAALA